MESVNDSLKEVVECIKNSKEYKMCIQLKGQMNANEELVSLIKKVKDCQKKYVRSNYSTYVGKELEELLRKLNSIPIYSIYMQNLDIVNQKIDYVREELNDYFYSLLNNE